MVARARPSRHAAPRVRRARRRGPRTRGRLRPPGRPDRLGRRGQRRRAGRGRGAGGRFPWCPLGRRHDTRRRHRHPRSPAAPVARPLGRRDDGPALRSGSVAVKGLAIDYAILLPALVPVAGLVLVLVADLVNPRLRRVPYAIAGLAALGSAAATVPGLALGGGSTRETFCLTGRVPAGALPTVDGLPQVCLWQADALASTLQLAAA